jgi:hypothetical protein
MNMPNHLSLTNEIKELLTLIYSVNGTVASYN